jgi:hypothetical protein
MAELKLRRFQAILMPKATAEIYLCFQCFQSVNLLTLEASCPSARKDALKPDNRSRLPRLSQPQGRACFSVPLFVATSNKLFEQSGGVF